MRYLFSTTVLVRERIFQQQEQQQKLRWHMPFRIGTCLCAKRDVANMLLKKARGFKKKCNWWRKQQKTL